MKLVHDAIRLSGAGAGEAGRSHHLAYMQGTRPQSGRRCRAAGSSHLGYRSTDHSSTARENSATRHTAGAGVSVECAATQGVTTSLL